MATQKSTNCAQRHMFQMKKERRHVLLISWYDLQDSVEINVVFVGKRKKYLQLKIR